MTRICATLVAITLVLALAACGSDSNEEKPLPTSPADTSSVTSVPGTGPAPTTTAAPAAESGRSCAAILNDGIQLATDWRNAQRGIVAPDESEYRARAQVLLDEARSQGCPVPSAVEQFLEYETEGSSG